MTSLSESVESRRQATEDPEPRPSHPGAVTLEGGLRRMRGGLEDLLEALAQAQESLGAMERRGSAGGASLRRGLRSVRELQRRQEDLGATLLSLRGVL